MFPPPWVLHTCVYRSWTEEQYTCAVWASRLDKNGIVEENFRDDWLPCNLSDSSLTAEHIEVADEPTPAVDAATSATALETEGTFASL